MPGNDEDRRAAATIATSLSSYVITGALAIVGAEAAIFVFILDKKQPSWSFYVMLALSFSLLCGSCFLGGKGIWEIYNNGANGTWRTTAGGKFALQLLLTLFGIFLFVICAFMVNGAADRPSPEEHGLALIQEDLSRIIPKQTALDELKAVRIRLDSIDVKLEAMRTAKLKECKGRQTK
jgi:succinate dehydrogenase hydrophobic anchor subunit